MQQCKAQPLLADIAVWEQGVAGFDWGALRTVRLPCQYQVLALSPALYSVSAQCMSIR